MSEKLKAYFTRQMMIVMTLGFSSGLPLMLVFGTLSLWLKDYNIALRLGGTELIAVHSPLASWSMPTVITILIIGIISYLLLRNKKLNY